jgi:hypothetical protein
MGMPEILPAKFHALQMVSLFNVELSIIAKDLVSVDMEKETLLKLAPSRNCWRCSIPGFQLLCHVTTTKQQHTNSLIDVRRHTCSIKRCQNSSLLCNDKMGVRKQQNTQLISCMDVRW